MPGEGVFLLSEVDQTALRGRLYELVTPCLDGRPVEELCAHLRGRASPAEVFYTLGQLEQKGYLTDEDAPLPAAESALWALQSVDPAAAARRLAELPVRLHALGDVDVAPLRELVQSLHVRLAPDAGLELIVTDSYLRAELGAMNAAALEAGRPWLLCKPTGHQVWIGPLFVPGRTGCWACLAERIRANAPLLGYVEQARGHTGAAAADRAWTPATLQVGWGLVANAVAVWVATGKLAALEGKLRTVDVLSLEAQAHTLVRLPSCPACGEPLPAGRPAAEFVLESCRKRFTEDGGHRALSPQQTLERFAHHVSPITGAVSRLDRDPAGDGVLHVYLSGHNAARTARNWAGLRRDLRSATCGKGTTDAQAKAGALCEALERYSTVFRGDEPRRRARMADLEGAGVHLHDCLLFSEKQYRERDLWNARNLRYDAIPVPFDPAAEIEWTPVWSMTRGAVRYVPTAFCYFNYPQDDEQAVCWSCSNGNAAGNTREEAVLQGFLELVERDSVALWWYNRVRRPGVDLDSFAVPYLSELREFLAGRGLELWALDLTSDLGIPVFTAISRRTNSPTEQILFGFGAHLDARVALLRAVTELNQMLGQILDTPPDAPPGAHLSDAATVEWLRTATCANQPYLVPRDGPSRVADDYPAWRGDDLREDVRACQALVERRGMEMLVLDLTRPEIGLPVVKVIVPGLRHFWARFAPGRLYDVPVRLGWLPAAVPEEQLNPMPMFL